MEEIEKQEKKMQKDETFKEKNELYKKSNDYRKKMQNAYQGKNYKEIHENMGTLNLLFEQMEQLGNKEGAGGKAKKQKIVFNEDGTFTALRAGTDQPSGPCVSSQRSQERKNALSIPAMGDRPPHVSPSIVA